ncbi:nucleotide-diphospho-sugar transferase [Cellulophaga algicola DSM 14237]|uniref:Nucleotide-diphospho-sugar transferase n=1 Tax=Cellulophaga algicola (strain DSM 14237 / IC166 / ACAM 630) TaxID=688270 RepID=E6XEM3_CELAD|nr:nucleotidyltransferase family protein [Cellulophaga algicola]ADV51351.1 nucleotide-diphospho-sugar transferase [Cellulophaga algicola DSM 14237]
MKKVALLVLAAGASSRMQTHIKQLLPWKNSTFLENALATAKDTEADQVFVVLGANYELIVSKANFDGVSLIRNENWQLGIGSSIAKGVAHLNNLTEKYDAILVSLADQPLVDASYYNQMITAFKNSNEHLVATNYGAKKGVPALFAKEYFVPLTHLNQDFGAQKLLNDKNALSINSSINNIDIDTWEDYQLLLNKID